VIQIPIILIGIGAASIGLLIGIGGSLLGMKIHFLLYENKNKRIKEM